MDARIHNVIPASRANGPGSRYVIWFQGCTLGCRGCFNPATHPAEVGVVRAVTDLVDDVLVQGPAIEGVTVSGGEPFQQPGALLALAENLKERTDLSLLVFSGYRLDELKRDPLRRQALSLIDVLIAGRFVRARHFGANLIGSSNQQLHCLSDRYKPEDFTELPSAEIIIESDGRVTATGVNAIDFAL